ncbi:hypothetical protein OIU74_029100 [Salix koriyanagi]|uniref:Uncharacterized protein n=1 Tax=Salix koriyanagi TaxID=2511006 RepID=A0A9Q0VD36_9ROSI|nr:hypothetical protein OIU74_029100 [Salix koriyanagi]
MRAFCELEVFKLKGRSASATYEGVVALSIPRCSFSNHTIWRNDVVLCWKCTKPDISRHSILWLLIVSKQIRSNGS